MTDIVLITTSDAANGRPDVLERMLTSVACALEQMPEAHCTVALLLQNCPPQHFEAWRAALPPFVIPFAIEGRTSLSAARNLLFEHLPAGAIGHDTIVGFPDDDCWYPDGTLPAIIKEFVGRPGLDFWFCRYASDPEASLGGTGTRPASVRDVVRNASSNTMFVRGRVLRAIDRFDERLGVGTPNLGGEDLDFALRAHALARLSCFCDSAAVGHRDKLRHLRATYYRGSLMVLARYAGRNLGAAREYGRKVAIGLYLVLRRELSLDAFLTANSLAFDELRHSYHQQG